MNPLKKIRQLAGALGYRLRPKREPSIARHRYPPEFHSLKPGDVAIDAGANVGTVTAALAASGATVHAFEPDEAAFALLSERCAHLPNVRLHAQAVHDQPGRLHLYRHLNHNLDPARFSQGSSLVAQKRNVDDGSGQFVEAIDLAAFINGLEGTVKLLKMDIEGAEYRVLEHLITTGAIHKVEKAFVETHARAIPSLRETDQRLRQRIARDGLSQRIDLNWV